MYTLQGGSDSEAKLGSAFVLVTILLLKVLGGLSGVNRFYKSTEVL